MFWIFRPRDRAVATTCKPEESDKRDMVPVHVKAGGARGLVQLGLENEESYEAWCRNCLSLVEADVPLVCLSQMQSGAHIILNLKYLVRPLSFIRCTKIYTLWALRSGVYESVPIICTFVRVASVWQGEAFRDQAGH